MSVYGHVTDAVFPLIEVPRLVLEQYGQTPGFYWRPGLYLRPSSISLPASNFNFKVYLSRFFELIDAVKYVPVRTIIGHE